MGKVTHRSRAPPPQADCCCAQPVGLGRGGRPRPVAQPALCSVETSRNTVSSASRAASGNSPPSRCLDYLRPPRSVFVGCVKVVSPPASRWALQAPEIANSITVAPPGWTTVCGDNATGWQTANHDHVASSWKVQPVPPAAGTCRAASTHPRRGAHDCRVLPHPLGRQVLLYELRTVQLAGGGDHSLYGLCTRPHGCTWPLPFSKLLLIPLLHLEGSI